MGVPDRGAWKEQVLAHAYEVDFRKQATAESICRWFLEAAWNHAEQLGVGFAALARQDRFWVLARLLVQIDQCLSWGQRAELTTWPRGVRGVLALRDFELCDLTGKRLAAGTSSWLVLDSSTRRGQRLDSLAGRIPCEITRQAVGRDAAKIPTAMPESLQLSTAARYSDIDVNLHVNSARYIGWCLDSYSPEFHQGHRLRSLEVNYVGETKWQDPVTVYSAEPSPLHFAHSLRNSKNEEVCRAAFVWAEAPKD